MIVVRISLAKTGLQIEAAQKAATGAEEAATHAEAHGKPVRSIADVLGKRRRDKTKISSAITFDSKKGRTARITDFMPAPAAAPASRHNLLDVQVIIHLWHSVHSVLPFHDTGKTIMLICGMPTTMA